MNPSTASARVPVRVVLVDDSLVVRTTVAKAVAAEADLDLVATAPDGEAGLAAIARTRPDVVILDLEMPVLDGVGTLARLRRTDPSLPVVIFSHLPKPDAGEVFDALSRGATEFVPKPTAAVSLPTEYLRTDLLTVVRALAARASPRTAARRVPRRFPSRVPRSLVAIACSTGGPDALATVLPGLDPFPPVPVLVVQHMPQRFTEILARRLDTLTSARVEEARDGEPVTPGTVLIAPGGRHMTVRMGPDGLRIALGDGPKVNFCRPSADLLLGSLAVAAPRRTLAVVMTGMGSDGLHGAQELVAAGGGLLAQTPGSAVVASMPAAVADLADEVLPLEAIAGEIVARCVRAAPT